MSNARFAHSRCPSHHDGLPACEPRRSTRGCRRIGSEQTSVVDHVVGEFLKRPEFLSFFSLIPSDHARHFHSFSACDRCHHPAWSTRWAPFCCCRVCLDATSSTNSQ